ncbi:peptidylprolyl isomerase [Leptolyngbya sp. FACHB-16]|uniref:peptidylprolyl isomerase n=1 Tax=unclassified Leptolyngbya TaxID=2650499 RepID=UPI0016847A5A|nr:peptidylprolyl isomerase [Leptolyngbya sp. FACHB-16]MBD2157420.1 peptidylprolyl isomerase [Leptolyngbya sp. FACHB-16]
MSTLLQVNQQTILSEDLLPLLNRYQLLEPLLREILIDQAIASLRDNAGETNSHWDGEAERTHKLQTFKQQKWQHRLPTYFLERSAQLDRVVYSMIRVQDPGIADELYFRIQENEQTFAELAAQYSQGPEAETHGLIGPVELGSYHPQFAHVLAMAPCNELMPPLQLDNWFVILRVEKRIPAQLDDVMSQRLLNELFEQWLQQEVTQVLSRSPNPQVAA